MSEAAVTVRVRKFMRNPLLKRRQMVLCWLECWRCRPLKWFIRSVLPFPRRSWRLLLPRSTTSRTISASSCSDSALLLVGRSYAVWWNRWWQIHWICSDLWFPERRQEVRGQVPSGQSSCFVSKVTPSSESRSTTVREERCWRRRRTTRRRSGVPAVVLLSTRPRRLRMTKPDNGFNYSRVAITEGLITLFLIQITLIHLPPHSILFSCSSTFNTFLTFTISSFIPLFNNGLLFSFSLLLRLILSLLRECLL